MKANLYKFQVICVAIKIGDTALTSEVNAN